MSLAYKETLDRVAAQGCSVPGCSHRDHAHKLFLRAACHPHAPLDVSYEAGSGELLVACKACGKPVVLAAIASRPETCAKG